MSCSSGGFRGRSQRSPVRKGKKRLPVELWAEEGRTDGERAREGGRGRGEGVCGASTERRERKTAFLPRVLGNPEVSLCAIG